MVDSEDLPLNISRETMQDTSLMQKLNKVLTGRFLKFLDEQSEKEAEAYEKFYAEYQRFLKEGVVTDFAHKEALGKLLRFESSSMDTGKLTSLADYVKRMPSEQKEIYCLLTPNRAAAESSPYFEVFRERKWEVLFLYDPWDEFVMEHLHTFDGKTLKLAEKADLNLSETKKDGALSEDAAKSLAQWLKETLGDKVGEVRVSQRLVESPAVVVDSDKFMTASMRRMMKAMKQDAGSRRPGEARFGNQSRASDHGASGRDAAERRRAGRQRRGADSRQRARGRRVAGRPAHDADPAQSTARKGAEQRIGPEGQSPVTPSNTELILCCQRQR